MAATIRSFTLLAGVQPGPVSLVLSDNPDLEKATILISARMQLDTPYKRSVLLSQREALLAVRNIVDAEIDRLDILQHARNQ